MPSSFQAISSSLSSRLTLAGMPATRLRAGTFMPAGTKAQAATMALAPISASSITTAFMPTSASRRTTQLCSTAPWPMWPFSSTTVSWSGKPCITQVSCTLAPLLQHDAAEVAAQAGAGADVAAGADDHVADQHRSGVHIGAGVDHRDHAFEWSSRALDVS